MDHSHSNVLWSVFFTSCYLYISVNLYRSFNTHSPPFIISPTPKMKHMFCILCSYNIHWNYGLLPQTWEDPSFSNSDVEGAFGDNDPVDVVEIGEQRRQIGEVLKVKPLAALAMIDEGELDWKIVAISLDDPKASLVNDVDDVEKHFPGTLTAIRDWFRDYKIPDGKPANKFGLGNKAANKDYALKVIEETNESWTKLIKRSIPAGELSLV
ncbi:hypothetical protein Ahy_A03g011773 [Arachis hypogaea]|uniref:inorganic diphosphatase n=1 Tax=Arachis hypogaea TaxID=3818 RepID=A0A445DRQ1_ARAHY|nr:hypothetical protein Ahy_A03g011773 [Arachis hypogaea]